MFNKGVIYLDKMMATKETKYQNVLVLENSWYNTAPAGIYLLIVLTTEALEQGGKYVQS